MKEIKMVDLHGQYLKIKSEIDQALQAVIDSSSFVQGPAVDLFKSSLQDFLKVKHVIPCANGTDALQIALMSLDLPKGAEIIIPSFSFGAPAEVVALLGFVPVFADADLSTFNVSVSHIESLINERTKAIIPVHLFGQPAPMQEIMVLAKKYSLFVIEDNAQSLGSNCEIDGSKKLAGTIGHFGTTSFFPSKNLGCMGDGGALFTNNDALAAIALMIANHGQKKKYHHQYIGINSRLDSMQAAVLNVKLKHLTSFNQLRKKAAQSYNRFFEGIDHIQVPVIEASSDHVFNQYTLKVSDGSRELLRGYLSAKGVPTMIYYPAPLHLQPVFYNSSQISNLPVAEKLCTMVLSLPMHTELQEDQLEYIAMNVATGLEMLKVKTVLSQ